MTPTLGLKRLGYGLAAVVLLAACAFAALPFLIRIDTVRDVVLTEIRNATGFEPVLNGDISVSWFPSGTATFNDVVLGEDDNGRPALSAERLTAQMRVLPLFLGRLEVAEITLLRPQLVITRQADGSSNWSGLLATLAQTLTPGAGAERRMSFSEIRMIDGRVLLRDGEGRLAETLDAVEVSLAWPSISKTFGATGSFVWRGEKVDASLGLADFRAALTGERSGLKVRVLGAPLKLAFDGAMSAKPSVKLEGSLSADSPSLRRALQWAGQTPLPGGGLGRFALKAQARVGGGSVALSSANVELDGNAAEGVLTFTTEGRTVLQGTLAAEALDLTPYVSSVRLLAGNDRDWSRVPISLDGLEGAEFDLRLSAARIAVGGVKVGRTGIAANLRDSRFAVTIGESQAFNGVLKGTVGLAKTETGADLKAQLQFTNVDLETCLAQVFGIRRLEGRGDLAVALQGSGPDVLGLTRTLNGKGTLVASAGAVTGLDVEQLLRRLERRPLSGGGDFRSGRTPFDKLAVTVKVTDGVVGVEDVRLDGAGVRLAVGGSASIPARDLDLKGTASLIAAAAKEPAGASPFELPFVVRGSWDDPVMLPDAESLIRRSGAAAPLLDAVRGGRTRDAVRNALDQLTRGAGGRPADAPAQPAAAAAQ